MYDSILSKVKSVKTYKVEGRVSSVKGMVLECIGISGFVDIGSRCKIYNRSEDNYFLAEVVMIEGHKTILMPFSEVYGTGFGCKIEIISKGNEAYPDASWVGRVINAFGHPIDDKGILKKGNVPYQMKREALPSHDRNRVGDRVSSGVKVIDTFLCCCEGQRMGIFAGSGVGKSVLMSMIAKYSDFDVKVIGLIGERGREVQEFIKEYLGEVGLKNSVIIVSTSDESPLMKKYAAYMTLTVSEYFRDQGMKVLCMMDSVTRFAMAQREIGLSSGEPPANKGYTPTVFAELPKLLERAGPGIGNGSITGLFTVLVEGDDTNEPISDAVRGILDGHMVMKRSIAERGRFPAIDVLRSISRMMPMCNTKEEIAMIKKARLLLSTYSDMEDMIRLGAYKKGADKSVDDAVHYYPLIEKFLSQGIGEKFTAGESYRLLARLLGT